MHIDLGFNSDQSANFFLVTMKSNCDDNCLNIKLPQDILRNLNKQLAESI